MDDQVAAIREQLKRLRATKLDVGPLDQILVDDIGDGQVRLRGSARGRDFSWHGPAAEALERLAALPAGEDVPDAEWTGPEMIRSEFTA